LQKEVSLRERFTPPKPAPVESKPVGFRLARSRFEHYQHQQGDEPAKLISPARPKLWEGHATASGPNSPVLVAPPASRSLHWSQHPSPAKATPPTAPSARRALNRLQSGLHRAENGLSRTPQDAHEGSRLRQQTPASSTRPSYSYAVPALSADENLKVASLGPLHLHSVPIAVAPSHILQCSGRLLVLMHVRK
jgi:hypothetical protein